MEGHALLRASGVAGPRGVAARGRVWRGLADPGRVQNPGARFSHIAVASRELLPAERSLAG